MVVRAGCTDGADPQELELAPGDILVAESHDGAISRIDPVTGARVVVSRGHGMVKTHGVQLDASKTQPLKRPDFSNVPSSVEQQALLSDLAPKRLDFLDDLPSSHSHGRLP